jgi:hypothetical protein
MDETLKGKRIMLIRMGDDPNPIKAGEMGTIQGVDGIGQIHVNWDNGRGLALIPGTDVYQIIRE